MTVALRKETIISATSMASNSTHTHGAQCVASAFVVHRACLTSSPSRSSPGISASVAYRVRDVLPMRGGGLETYPQKIFRFKCHKQLETMPLAMADFGFCDRLRPHYEQHPRKVKRAVTPGPGTYDVSSVIPGIKTTKYQRAGTASFGESRSKRFQSNQTGHNGPGFQYTSYGRRHDSSRVSMPPRTVFGKAHRSVLETIKQTPGPSDYAADAALSSAPRAPAHSFSGPLAKLERFAETKRDLNRNVSPGPNKYKPATGIASDKIVGTPTMGTSRRFMSLTVSSITAPH